MFSCLVAPTGEVVRSGAYRGTRGSELLEQELLKRLATARFIPAIHNHQPVIAIFYGTVKFAVANGKPRLRIFANQQLEEVDKETDFIDPQPYVGQDSKFTGLHYPETGSTVAVTGVVELALNVDAKGNLTNLQVLSEEPPLLGFGDAALIRFQWREIHSGLPQRPTGRMQRKDSRLLQAIGLTPRQSELKRVAVG